MTLQEEPCPVAPSFSSFLRWCSFLRAYLRSRLFFVTQTPTFGNTGNTFFVFLPVMNAGTADADSIELISVSLTHVGTVVGNLLQPTSLPFKPGSGFLGAGGTRTLDLEFSNSQLVSGSTYMLKVNGTYQVNGKTAGFAVNRPLLFKPGLTAKHMDVINLIGLKGNSLPDTDQATQNQMMLEFVSGLPLVARAGIGVDTSWILWADTGRKYLFLNNDHFDRPGTPASRTQKHRRWNRAHRRHWPSLHCRRLRWSLNSRTRPRNFLSAAKCGF
jgi:hypothetical protein